MTGTEQALLAAVTAEGTTTILNAASEPHVQDLCHFLNALGAQILGVGSNTLTVQGVPRLGGGNYHIMSDHMEVGSFIGLAYGFVTGFLLGWLVAWVYNAVVFLKRGFAARSG